MWLRKKEKNIRASEVVCKETMQPHDTDFHWGGKNDRSDDKVVCKFPLLLSLVEILGKQTSICISPSCSCFAFNFWFCLSCKMDWTNEILITGNS